MGGRNCPIVLFTVIFISSLISQVRPYPFGAPFSTCFTMYPKHGGSVTQTTPSPFSLSITPNRYVPGQDVTIEVVIPSDKQLTGIQTVARRDVGNRDEIVGQFVGLPGNKMKAFDCFMGTQNMATHSNKEPVSNLTLIWKAPDKNVGKVRFITTFLESFSTFWYDVITELPVNSLEQVQDPAYPAIALTQQTSPKINFTGCGDTKGCFFYAPFSCSGADCVAAATYVYNKANNEFDIELHTNKDQDYISIGWSPDAMMGDEATMTCTGRNNKVSVQEGYNPAKYNSRNLNVLTSSHQVNYIDGHLQCRFKLPLTAKWYKGMVNGNASYLEVDFTRKFYLMLAWGTTMPGSDVIAHHHDLPTVSSSPVDMTQHSITKGSTFHVIVQWHGSLMIVAWILLTGVVTLVARHFRHNTIWFQVHRALAVTVFVLTATGMILIFYHYGTEELSKPAFTHACVGIATCVALTLQITAGALRPGLDNKLRPYFNWGHRCLGHSTHILAATTMLLAFNIKYIRTEMKEAGTITLAVWIAFQVGWLVLFEVLRQRHSRSGEMVGGVGNQLSIQEGEKTEKKTNLENILLVLYILILAVFCFVAIGVIVEIIY